MFSLIIAIISIALVAALALATIYYGGDAFNKGSAGAKAAQLINEGQQIAGAVTLSQVDAAASGSTTVGTVADLATGTSKYLAQVPSGWDADVAVDGTDKLLLAANVPTKVCDAVNERANLTRPADVTEAEGSTAVYGCFGATDAAGTVFYRL